EYPRCLDARSCVSHFYRHRVFTVTTDGHEQPVLEVEGQPSGTGWMPDDSLLVVSRKDMQILRRSPDGEVSVHADLSSISSFHLNDMVVDADGRAYVGNFGFDL